MKPFETKATNIFTENLIKNHTYKHYSQTANYKLVAHIN